MGLAIFHVPSSPLTSAITRFGMRSSPIAKCTRLRWVCAPQERSAGTSISPIESVSPLVQAACGISHNDGPPRPRPGLLPSVLAAFEEEKRRLKGRIAEGNALDAAARVLVYIGKAQHRIEKSTFDMGSAVRLQALEHRLSIRRQAVETQPRGLSSGWPHPSLDRAGSVLTWRGAIQAGAASTATEIIPLTMRRARGALQKRSKIECSFVDKG